MPDLFVAPDEKAPENNTGRNRTAAVPQENPPKPPDMEKAVEEEVVKPVIPITENITINNQPALQPETEAISTVTNVSSEQAQSQKLPFNEEVERRNMMPIFASFWENPRSVYFDTQEPDEHIFLFLRRHFVTNVPWIVFTVFMIILPPLALYLFTVINYPLTFLSQPLTEIILILYYLLVLTNAFVNFLDWYYNITIITSKRVLDIQLKDLVNKKVAATKISLIQDVDFKQTGTIPSIFNYGDVIMQTAGTLVNFVADAVPNPELVVQVVESLIGKKETVAEGGENAAV